MTSDRNGLLSTQCSCMGQNPNCYKCGGWGYIDAIGKGRASDGAAGAPAASVKSKKKKGKARPTVVCPQCGSLVERLTRHLRKAHPAPKPPAPSPVPGLVPLSKSDQGLVVCPHCRCSVKASRLSKHIARVHSGIETNSVQKKHRSHRVEGDSRDTQIPQRYDRDPQMDATRPYADTYRDHGQFGSHPSHDDYGDESEP